MSTGEKDSTASLKISTEVSAHFSIMLVQCTLLTLFTLFSLFSLLTLLTLLILLHRAHYLHFLNSFGGKKTFYAYMALLLSGLLSKKQYGAGDR